MIKQLIGPFQANQELCTFGVIKHLGIQIKSLAPKSVFINNQEIIIDKINMYELKDVEITSLKLYDILHLPFYN